MKNTLNKSRFYKKNIIKNIFIFMLAITFLPFSGCKKTPVASSLAQNTSQEQSPESLEPKELVDSVTYVHTSQGFLAASYIENGKQLISGELRYSDISTQFPSPELLSNIDTSKMYIDGAIPKYLGYNSHKPIMNLLASNGDWDFFPTKVGYEKYSLRNQPSRKEWTDYFRKKLDEISPNIPIVFEEAFFFDWKGDGTQSVIVNIGNTFEKAISTDFFEGYNLSISPTPPPTDQTVFYQMSAIFTYEKNEIHTFDLLNSFNTYLSETPNVLYVPPKDTDNPYSLDYYTIQYDEKNQFTVYPVYANHIAWESFHTCVYNNTYLLCDVDGNGKSELIVHRPIHYAGLQIFQFDNGEIRNLVTVSTL